MDHKVKVWGQKMVEADTQPRLEASCEPEPCGFSPLSQGMQSRRPIRTRSNDAHSAGHQLTGMKSSDKGRRVRDQQLSTCVNDPRESVLK